jgi:cathepsin B
MKAFTVVLLALLACALAQFITEEEVAHINAHSTWKAGRNQFLEGRSLADVTRLLGVLPKAKGYKRPTPTHPEKVAASIPDTFDSRQQWPKCQSIGTIRNQAECGSCWAFGATEAFTDRYCIGTNGTSNPIMAPEYLIACDDTSNGCEGGSLSSAWYFLTQYGLPTEACQPYTIPTCPPAQQPCLNFKPTPACHQTCYGNTSMPFTTYTAYNYYSVGGWIDNVEKIQTEIMTNGPVEAAFTVYADFLQYKSGVYQHETGSALGGHAVKVIGWGVENGTPYWNIANSWTTYWGDKGYFKIRRGDDNCGIEDDVTAGLASSQHH